MFRALAVSLTRVFGDLKLRLVFFGGALVIRMRFHGSAGQSCDPEALHLTYPSLSEQSLAPLSVHVTVSPKCTSLLPV